MGDIQKQLLAYTKLGWYIFPIRSGGKAPLTQNGFKDASNDMDQVLAWHQQYPGCNWAVATGPSKLLVVDMDLYKTGAPEEVAVSTALGGLPETARAKTGSGGVHLFYATDAIDVPSNKPIAFVDIRASTGYVLIAPSRLESGGEYVWQLSPERIVEAPVSLIERIKKTTPSPTRNLAVSPKLEVFLPIGSGRWETLRRIGGGLRASGFNRSNIEISLNAFASTQCEYDESISKNKIRKLAKYLCEKPPTNSKNPTYSPVAIKHTPQKKQTVTIKLNENIVVINLSALPGALARGAVVVKDSK